MEPQTPVTPPAQAPDNTPAATQLPVAVSNATIPPQPLATPVASTPPPRKKHILRWIMLGIVGIFVILVVAGTIIGPSKTITYNNGVGSSFKLSFYRDYKTVPTTNLSGNSALITKLNPQVKSLVSESTGSNGNYLTVLSLGAYEAKAVDRCSEFGQASAGQVYNTHMKATVYLCVVDSTLENAFMRCGSSLCEVAFDTSATANNTTGASTADQKDINQIVESIQPL